MKIRTLANFKLSNGKMMKMGEYDDTKEPFPEEIQEEIRRAKSQAKLVVKKKRVEILDDRKREEPSSPPSIPVPLETNTLEVSDEETVLETAETGNEEQEEIVEEVAPKKARKRKK